MESLTTNITKGLIKLVQQKHNFEFNGQLEQNSGWVQTNSKTFHKDIGTSAYLLISTSEPSIAKDHDLILLNRHSTKHWDRLSPKFVETSQKSKRGANTVSKVIEVARNSFDLDSFLEKHGSGDFWVSLANLSHEIQDIVKQYTKNQIHLEEWTLSSRERFLKDTSISKVEHVLVSIKKDFNSIDYKFVCLEKKNSEWYVYDPWKFEATEPFNIQTLIKPEPNSEFAFGEDEKLFIRIEGIKNFGLRFEASDQCLHLTVEEAMARNQDFYVAFSEGKADLFEKKKGKWYLTENKQKQKSNTVEFHAKDHPYYCDREIVYYIRLKMYDELELSLKEVTFDDCNYTLDQAMRHSDELKICFDRKSRKIIAGLIVKRQQENKWEVLKQVNLHLKDEITTDQLVSLTKDYRLVEVNIIDKLPIFKEQMGYKQGEWATCHNPVNFFEELEEKIIDEYLITSINKRGHHMCHSAFVVKIHQGKIDIIKVFGEYFKELLHKPEEFFTKGSKFITEEYPWIYYCPRDYTSQEEKKFEWYADYDGECWSPGRMKFDHEVCGPFTTRIQAEKEGARLTNYGYSVRRVLKK